MADHIAKAAEATSGAAVRPMVEVSPFESLRQVEAGDLSVGYADLGPGDGPAVLLLHGWPYDIHAYAEVAPILADAGYRVIVPHLRGYGTTRFRTATQSATPSRSALGKDAVDLLDALDVDRAIVGGFDWGARSADVVAALWPERCAALVSVSGYLIGNQRANASPLPPRAELAWWYQFYFATERGRARLRRTRRNDFNRLIWELASPSWRFDDETFERTAASFDNPDHDEIVIHNYRWRLGLARRRSGARRSRGTARRGSPDHGAHDHARGRRERRAASRAERLRWQVHRPVRTPDDPGRRRA